MTKWIISLVVLLAVGFASYKAGQRSVPAALNSEHIEEKIKTDLVELTKKDFEEYQNLKTLEDRYKKADEILGKIVTVFLADLGMRLNFKNTNAALLDASCGLPKPALAATVAPPPSFRRRQCQRPSVPCPKQNPHHELPFGRGWIVKL